MFLTGWCSGSFSELWKWWQVWELCSALKAFFQPPTGAKMSGSDFSQILHKIIFGHTSKMLKLWFWTGTFSSIVHLMVIFIRRICFENFNLLPYNALKMRNLVLANCHNTLLLNEQNQRKSSPNPNLLFCLGTETNVVCEVSVEIHKSNGYCTCLKDGELGACYLCICDLFSSVD